METIREAHNSAPRRSLSQQRPYLSLGFEAAAAIVDDGERRPDRCVGGAGSRHGVRSAEKGRDDRAQLQSGHGSRHTAAGYDCVEDRVDGPAFRIVIETADVGVDERHRYIDIGCAEVNGPRFGPPREPVRVYEPRGDQHRSARRHGDGSAGACKRATTGPHHEQFERIVIVRLARVVGGRDEATARRRLERHRCDGDGERRLHTRNVRLRAPNAKELAVRVGGCVRPYPRRGCRFGASARVRNAATFARLPHRAIEHQRRSRRPGGVRNTLAHAARPQMRSRSRSFS